MLRFWTDATDLLLRVAISKILGKKYNKFY